MDKKRKDYLERQIKEGKRLGLDTSTYREEARRLKNKEIINSTIKKAGHFVDKKEKQIEKNTSRLLRSKILKKPKAKVHEVSARKLIKQYVNSGYTMFKSEGNKYEPQEHPVQDRSNLFISEFNKEKKKMGFL